MLQIPYPIWDLELPDDYLRYSADAAYAASTYRQARQRKPIDILMGMTRDEFASYGRFNSIHWGGVSQTTSRGLG